MRLWVLTGVLFLTTIGAIVIEGPRVIIHRMASISLTDNRMDAYEKRLRVQSIVLHMKYFRDDRTHPPKCYSLVEMGAGSSQHIISHTEVGCLGIPENLFVDWREP